MELARSRLEINIRKLIKVCESMAKEDEDNRRFNKYVEALQEMIDELKLSPEKPQSDVMLSYERRVEFLRGVLNVSKLPNPVERVIAAQQLPVNIETPDEPKEGLSITTQIHQKTTAKYNREIREELFETKSGSSDGLKRRNVTNGQIEIHDIEYHRERQAEIVEDWSDMTRQLKENALMTSAAIKKDLGVLKKSDEIIEANTKKLNEDLAKLDKLSSSSTFWQWVMLGIVIIVFFNMILFIKAFPKKNY